MSCKFEANALPGRVLPADSVPQQRERQLPTAEEVDAMRTPPVEEVLEAYREQQNVAGTHYCQCGFTDRATIEYKHNLRGRLCCIYPAINTVDIRNVQMQKQSSRLSST